MSTARIDRNTEIMVQSNIHASFSYHEGGVDLELSSLGDEDFITFGELKKLASGSNKAILKRMYILITDVEDENFTVDEVVRQLKLESEYEAAKKVLNKSTISVGDFKDFVLKASSSELEDAMKHEHLKEVLVESALELHKRRKIDLDRISTALNACGIEGDRFYNFLHDISMVEEKE